MKKQLIFLMVLFLTGATAIAQIDRSQMPTSGPTPEINLGKPYTFELKNGLQVLVVSDKKLPTLNMSLDLNNPPVFEGDKAGVQSLTGALIGKGSTETSKEEFNEKVDYLGANIFVGVNGGFAGGLSKYKEEIFQLFTEAAFKPNFTQKELDFEKSQAIEGLKSGENSAAAIAGKVRSALVYGKNHPAGEFSTEETINSVTLEDVNAFYTNYFKPSNGYLIITGDIEKKEAKKLVKKYFGKWDKGMAPKPVLPELADVEETQINLIDVPNAVQTELAVMSLSELKMSDPDYYAVLVANYVFGGSFGSYLNMNLREANGYTYGARSNIGTGRNYKGTFSATAKVRNEVTDSALVETFKELNRIRDEYVEDEMLSTAKAKFLGSFIMQSEDKSVVASRSINIEKNDLDKDFYKNFISNIDKVTKEDVKRVANKYLSPDNLRIVLVGKAADILEPLEKMKLNGKTVPVKFYDKDANETERPSTIEIPAGLTAQTVVDSYVKAIGGKDAVAAVNSTSYFAIYTTPQGDLILDMKAAKNDKLVKTIKMAGNTMMRQVVANNKASVSGMGGSQELSGADLELAQVEAMFIPEFYSADKATLAGAEMMGDNQVYVIKWSDNKKAFYDVNTGLKVAEETTQEAQGQKVAVMIKYSDYKETSGVKFPMTITQQMMGQNLAFKVEKVSVNTVKDADFK
ncbi:putative Zn-dependent peptidase [Nonlabens xylanidelens]|uniref:Putative Zn-dependent peptidase n=1 Tax=Nonlabens xylanidelens TaxID=191564 RepID=A0A2S6IRC6_9FLAO|nr:pitrilysin family protein [Nonlabens xylanidelens]PPK96799.1 putative Zn-dependent peptidase [Nonlabens xylanidelens]PQJ13504.1 peptidase, M16 family protein [Nonlabens xylanidelens]